MAPGTLSTREASNRGRGNDKRRIARLRADVRPLGDAQARREEQWQDDGREEARHEKPPWYSSLDRVSGPVRIKGRARSEEHTSELQSHSDLVCRLLLEKKKHQEPLSG